MRPVSSMKPLSDRQLSCSDSPLRKNLLPSCKEQDQLMTPAVSSFRVTLGFQADSLLILCGPEPMSTQDWWPREVTLFSRRPPANDCKWQ